MTQCNGCGNTIMYFKHSITNWSPNLTYVDSFLRNLQVMIIWYGECLSNAWPVN